MTCSSLVLSLFLSLSLFFSLMIGSPVPPTRTTGGTKACYANGAISRKSNGAINYIYISFATSPLFLFLLPSFFFFITPSAAPSARFAELNWRAEWMFFLPLGALSRLLASGGGASIFLFIFFIARASLEESRPSNLRSSLSLCAPDLPQPPLERPSSRSDLHRRPRGSQS